MKTLNEEVSITKGLIVENLRYLRKPLKVLRKDARNNRT